MIRIVVAPELLPPELADPAAEAPPEAPTADEATEDVTEETNCGHQRSQVLPEIFSKSGNTFWIEINKTEDMSLTADPTAVAMLVLMATAVIVENVLAI